LGMDWALAAFEISGWAARLDFVVALNMRSIALAQCLFWYLRFERQGRMT